MPPPSCCPRCSGPAPPVVRGSLRRPLRFDPLPARRRAAAAARAAADPPAGPPPEPRQFSSLDSEYWEADPDPADASAPPLSSPSDNYCIIESRESVKDFAALGLADVREAVRARRNRIYFLMEEVRRLRIQERLKAGAATDGVDAAADAAREPFPSAIPFFPPLSDDTVRSYGRLYAVLVASIILFGGLVAPVLEVKLGLGGTSYADLIAAARLPSVLASVDPIVASFCGGAVGVLTTLLIVEKNNAALVAGNRCAYCGGVGYIACGACGGAAAGAVSRAAGEPACATCSGTGKVACIGCLCTGKKVARETDQRLDPFS